MNIVIASVLKPLTDVRHYHKIGLSLANGLECKVFILARDSNPLPNHSDIFFNALTSSKISFIERVLAPFRFYFQLLKIRPKVLIVCTHELLVPAVLYKLFFQVRVIYDVQENYYLNIQSNETYPGLIRTVLSNYVRLKETVTSRFMYRFWLAEECYLTELQFLSSKADVFENKSLFSQQVFSKCLKDKQKINFLFSGTIAIENGVLDALAFVKAYHQVDPLVRLTIVGCCHSISLLAQLQDYVKDCSFVTLKIDSTPIDYEFIKEEMFKADLGLICYKPQANFTNKIPTKLFEYLSVGMPMLISNNSKWRGICDRFNAGVSFNIENFSIADIRELLLNKRFYENTESTREYTSWKFLEKDLIDSIVNLK